MSLGILHAAFLTQNKLPQRRYRAARNLEISSKYLQRRVCFVNVKSSLHENVVFSVCACMCNAAYVIFIMWNSISGLDAWYHFRFNISCGLAVMEKTDEQKKRLIGARATALPKNIKCKIFCTRLKNSPETTTKSKVSCKYDKTCFIGNAKNKTKT